MNLHAEYPLALILPCLLVGALAGYWLYRNNPLQLSSKQAKLIHIILGVLRSIVIALLLILLVGPMIKWISYNTEKPILVIAVDQSLSMNHHRDSSFIQHELPSKIENLQKVLKEQYNVIPIGFDASLKPYESGNFNGSHSDLASALVEISNTYGNNKLNGIVLISDGIVNSGDDPLQVVESINTPIYTVATGDTARVEDLSIKNIRYNITVYSGNDFSIIVELGLSKFTRKKIDLKISCDGKPIFEKQIDLINTSSFLSLPITLHSPNPGTHRYTISVTPFVGEKNIYNNQKTIVIETVKSRKNIALLSASPHPDIAALTACIKASDQYDLTFLTPESALPSTSFNLVIAHQVPSNSGKALDFLKQLISRSQSTLFITGSQTGFSTLGDLTNNNFSIQTGRGGFNETTAIPSNEFTLFQTDEELLRKAAAFPPLTVPYGNYHLPQDAQILLKQKIGNVNTDYPLWAFLKNGNKKIGFIAGEGFWKWYLQDAVASDHPVTEQLIALTVNYLTSGDQQSPFKISAQPIYESGSHILMNAELVDPSGVLTTAASPIIKITNAKGKSFEFGFSPESNTYSLDAGIMPPGEYTFNAEARLGNTTYKANGAFSVNASILEYVQSVSDFQMLNELATATGGSHYSINQFEELTKKLLEKDQSSHIIYKKEELIPMIDLTWLLACIGSMMVIEWLIRKWNGSI